MNVVYSLICVNSKLPQLLYDFVEPASRVSVGYGSCWSQFDNLTDWSSFLTSFFGLLYRLRSSDVPHKPFITYLSIQNYVCMKNSYIRHFSLKFFCEISVTEEKEFLKYFFLSVEAPTNWRMFLKSWLKCKLIQTFSDLKIGFFRSAFSSYISSVLFHLMKQKRLFKMIR